MINIAIFDQQQFRRTNLWVTVITLVLLALWIPVVVYKAFHFIPYHNGMLRHALPDSVLQVLIWLLPSLEVIAIGLLVTPRTLRYGLFLSAVLLFGYTGYVGLGVMTLWVVFECFCSKLINSMSWWGHFWFSLTFLTVNVAGLILIKKQNNRGGTAEGHATEGKRSAK